MTTTTTTTRPKVIKQIETVRKHSPITVNEKAQQECWANYGVAFEAGGERTYLQAGQFLPAWVKTGSRWSLKTPFTLSVVSAFVMDGRYMIRGGDSKLGSHPEIQDWENVISPVSGQASELRFPGGVRRITPSNMPMLASNAGNYESRPCTAKAFHTSFSQAALYTGCPIALFCRMDKTSKKLFGTWGNTVIDMVRGEATSGYELPIPMISSNEEEVVLKDYPQNWTSALLNMLDYLGVTEVGVMYKAQGDDLIEDISSDRPQEVYRNALVKGDLGFSTLDPDLYERMLPLATGRFDAELMVA